MDIERVDQIIDKHQSDASALIQVLLDIQAENHWLPQEALERVSEILPFSHEEKGPIVIEGKIEQAATKYRQALEGSGRVETLAGDILRRKAIDLVVDTAEVVDADGTAVAIPASDLAAGPGDDAGRQHVVTAGRPRAGGCTGPRARRLLGGQELAGYQL